MNTIIVGTTPTISVNNFQIINPLEISAASFIISRHGQKLIEKTLEDAEVTSTYISWDLTQEETLVIKPGDAKVQCNFIIGEKRYATPATTLTFVRNVKNEVM